MSRAELLDPRLLASPAAPSPGDPVALGASHCGACDRWEFPALAACPACGRSMEDSTLSSNARIVGFTAVLHPPPGAEVDVPYVVAVATFPERISVLGVVVDATIDHVALGDTVTTIAVDVGGRLGYGYRTAP